MLAKILEVYLGSVNSMEVFICEKVRIRVWYIFKATQLLQRA